jgi:hypothetical protein
VARARLALLFVLLIAPDLSCPFVPGALVFEVDACVDGHAGSCRPLPEISSVVLDTSAADVVVTSVPRRAPGLRPAGRVGFVEHPGRSSIAASRDPSRSLSEDG